MNCEIPQEDSKTHRPYAFGLGNISKSSIIEFKLTLLGQNLR